MHGWQETLSLAIPRRNAASSLLGVPGVSEGPSPLEVNGRVGLLLEGRRRPALLEGVVDEASADPRRDGSLGQPALRSSLQQRLDSFYAHFRGRRRRRGRRGVRYPRWRAGPSLGTTNAYGDSGRPGRRGHSTRRRRRRHPRRRRRLSLRLVDESSANSCRHRSCLGRWAAASAARRPAHRRRRAGAARALPRRRRSPSGAVRRGGARGFPRPRLALRNFPALPWSWLWQWDPRICGRGLPIEGPIAKLVVWGGWQLIGCWW